MLPVVAVFEAPMLQPSITTESTNNDLATRERNRISMHPETDGAEQSELIFQFIIHACDFPTMTCQNSHTGFNAILFSPMCTYCLLLLKLNVNWM